MYTERFFGAADLGSTTCCKSNGASGSTRHPVSRAAELSAIPPLHWWRHLPAESFTAAHVVVLQRAISGIGMVSEPRWPAAVRGDAAAAIGIALRTMKRRGTPGAIIDLHMSVVLLSAIKGDPAAVLVLATMVVRSGAKSDKEALKRSWLRWGLRGRTAKAAIEASTRGPAVASRATGIRP